MKRLMLHILSPLLALGVWELLARTGIVDARFFPAPSTIIHYLIFISPEEGILRDIAASLKRILWGYLFGSLCGIMLGMAMGLSKTLHALFYSLITSLYPIPKIAILPLIMLIFGIGDLSKIVVVGIGSFFLVLLNTLHGTQSIPKIVHDVVFVYKITTWNYITRVVMPGALPSIFTGLKLAIGYSLVIVVAAEFSGANEGIGYLIWQSWETFSIKAMYAAIFVIGLLGSIFTYALGLLERWMIPWQRHR